MLQTGNTSLGVTLLAVLVERAAAALPGWDVEVVEMHHRHEAGCAERHRVVAG